MARTVVDGMNVIGSRPDGWWRDRDAAARRLLVRLQHAATRSHDALTLVLDGLLAAVTQLQEPLPLPTRTQRVDEPDEVVDVAALDGGRKRFGHRH